MIKDDVFHVVLDTNAIILEFDGLAPIISGYSASEVIGRNWFEVFIPQSNTEEMLTVFHNFLKGNLSYWEYENVITSKDGKLHNIKWKNSLRRSFDNIPVAISSQGRLI